MAPSVSSRVQRVHQEGVSLVRVSTAAPGITVPLHCIQDITAEQDAAERVGVYDLLKFLPSGARTRGSSPLSSCGYFLLVFPSPRCNSSSDTCQFVSYVELLQIRGCQVAG
jgi:hypothetical protein